MSAHDQRQPSKRGPATLLALIIVCCLAAGFAYYRHGIGVLRTEAEKNLGVIAQWKAEELQHWRRERLRHGQGFFENTIVMPLLVRMLRGTADHGTARSVQEWMNSRCRLLAHEKIMLFDGRGKAVAIAPEGAGAECVRIGQHLAGAASARDVFLTDIFYDEAYKKPYLYLVIPVFSGEKIFLGALLCLIDPYEFLYPLIKQWPAPSRTAEALLVRREGDEVVFLNELRHQKNTAFTLRRRADEPALPAAMAVRGVTGIASGMDYRGRAVVADLRPVPDTPWFLVTKIDRDEIYAPARTHALRVTVAAVLLSAMAGAFVFLFWWRRQTRYYQELHAAGRAYHELSSKYQLVTKYANDMIFLADADKKIIEANDLALQTYGYTREEMAGLPIEMLRPPAVRKDIERQFAKDAASNGMRFETLGLKKDGTVFPIESSVRVLTFEGREFFVGIVRDISEQEKASAALETSRREWEEIFQAVGNPAFILDPDNGVVNVNRAMAAALGMAEQDIIGRKCYELLHGSDHLPKQCPFSRMIATNQTEVSEMEVKTLGGTFLVTCTPMFDEAGRLVKAIHIAADITAIKDAQKKVQESEERFAALAAASPEAIIITDHAGTIVFWNRSAEKMFGFQRDEMVGASSEIYIPDDILPTYRQGLAQFRETGISQLAGTTYVSAALRKDGTRFPVEVSFCVWQTGGRTFFGSMVRDITERERAEEQIRQQLAELRQWQKVMLDREDRMIELKQEVNELCGRLGERTRYGPDA